MFALLRFLELLSKADTFPFIYFIVATQRAVAFATALFLYI